jgi:inositol 1,4,5-triphosphate receptor type 1/inositol 1,4,5-triphosphate receptor type 3
MRKIIEKEENEQKKIELQNHFDKLGATRMVLLVLSDFSKILN